MSEKSSAALIERFIDDVGSVPIEQLMEALTDPSPSVDLVLERRRSDWWMSAEDAVRSWWMDNEVTRRIPPRRLVSIAHPADLWPEGWPRTGTTSLKAALEQLGVTPVEHMSSLTQRLERVALYEAVERGEPGAERALLHGYEATVDNPGCCFWRELTQAFPDAVVVLTTRDPATWYRSYTETIHPHTFGSDRTGDPPEVRRLIALLQRVWLDRALGGAATDEAAATQAFVRHERDVLDALGPRVLRFDPALGWGPLCEALDLPVPEAPFPHKNARTYIRAHGVHEW